MLGRINASFNVLITGAGLFGALLGGVLAEFEEEGDFVRHNFGKESVIMVKQAADVMGRDLDFATWLMIGLNSRPIPPPSSAGAKFPSARSRLAQ